MGRPPSFRGPNLLTVDVQRQHRLRNPREALSSHGATAEGPGVPAMVPIRLPLRVPTRVVFILVSSKKMV